MVAAEVGGEQRLPKEREPRLKAAAWAWYQRSGGSLAPNAGKSEAFASRCTARLSPSRFQREATMLARILASDRASDATLTSSSSSMDKFSGSSSSFSHDCMPTFGDASDRYNPTGMDASPNADQDIAIHDQPSLDIVSMDSSACWDCGSSLFDSFELVAMSKKLDAELCEASLDVQLEDTGSDLNHQKVFALCDAPQNAISPPNSPPPSAPHQETVNTSDIFDKLISSSDKQSKQAVYDMFCHYGDAAKHVAKQACKRSPPADTTCDGETRKHKLRPGRMSFHGLAKAIHSITHLHLHATSGSGGGSGGEVIEQDHHHHHHLHYSPQAQASTNGKAMYIGQGKGGHNVGGGTLPPGDHPVYDDVMEGAQNKSRHIHHHHHHHYHYLFHSDDDFRLQPLDKSLIVAAAGLRSTKASPAISSPALSSYLESPARGDFPVDFGQKWADFGTIPSPNFQY